MIKKEEKEDPKMIIQEEHMFVIFAEKLIFRIQLYIHTSKPNIIL
jgi:hypothetical protein